MTDIPLIAIVDDDPGMRDALGALVRSLGYRAALFASSEAFLAARANWSCLISDLHLPGGRGGLDLAEMPGVDGRRMILIGACPDTAARARAAAAGIACVLAKPCDGAALIAGIEAIVASG